MVVGAAVSVNSAVVVKTSFVAAEGVVVLGEDMMVAVVVTSMVAEASVSVDGAVVVEAAFVAVEKCSCTCTW